MNCFSVPGHAHSQGLFICLLNGLLCYHLCKVGAIK